VRWQSLLGQRLLNHERRIEMTDYGLNWLPRDAKTAIEVAQRAEAVGIGHMGLVDSPFLYYEAYIVITACLLNTTTLRMGPNVTNAVNRHWSLHAATMRTLDEYAPGRFFVGIAAGDGAVHSIGLKPHGARALEEAVNAMRERGPQGGEIHVGAGGPLKAGVAGRSADKMIAGTGMEPEHVETLRAAARAGRKAVGRTDDIPVWVPVNIHLVENERDIPAARANGQAVAVGYARHTFDYGFEGKGVPARFQEAIVERFKDYQFLSHATLGQVTPNGSLLADVPEIEEYVVNRFHLIGTPEQCRERVAEFVEESGVDGVWLNMTDPDPVGQVDLIARMLDGLI
jgi:alkanesulfonate monooxygenase SsuD/methylene tetrahydromethanopterin reductase-like flavin-dependent oxidoreductase (luciferase family)